MSRALRRRDEEPSTAAPSSEAGDQPEVDLSIEEAPPQKPEITTTARVALASPPPPSGLKGLRTRLGLFAEAIYVRLRWHLREGLEDLRTRDRFFRWKATIVAGWIGLSLVSLGVARSNAAADPASNKLQAYVVIRPTTMGWGLLVANQSKRDWQAVEIHLDGYSHSIPRIASGEQLILGPLEFEREGERLPESHIPLAVQITTERGQTTVELGE